MESVTLLPSNTHNHVVILNSKHMLTSLHLHALKTELKKLVIHLYRCSTHTRTQTMPVIQYFVRAHYTHKQVYAGHKRNTVRLH
jgi:hypothetical protein